MAGFKRGAGRGAIWFLIAGLVVIGAFVTIINNPHAPVRWWLGQAWGQWVEREPAAAGTVGILVTLAAIALSVAVQDAFGARKAPAARHRATAVAHPRRPDGRRDRTALQAEARRLSALGEAARSAKDLPGARKVFGEALSVYKTLVRDHPSEDLSRELADAYGRYASAAGALGDHGAERSARRVVVAIERALLEGPSAPEGARSRLAGACARLGAAERACDDLAAAHQAYASALEQLEQLPEGSSTGDARFKTELLFTLKCLGDVAEARNDRRAALAYHQRGLPIAEHLAAQASAGARAYIDLAFTRRRIAELRGWSHAG